jgi:hypothetical protein
MNDKYRYGGPPADVKSAAGIKGVILRTGDDRMLFRVHHDPERYTDYAIRHDNLSVTIDDDELVAFYKACPRASGDGEKYTLDRSPEVLGLERIGD